MWGAKAAATDPRFFSSALFAQREIRLALAGHSHGLGLLLGALVPRGHGIASVRNIFNLVTSGLVSDGKVWCGGYYDVSRHLGMDIAQQRHGAGIVGLESILLTLRPGTDVVRHIPVAAHRHAGRGVR